jgi:hypothetical protein
MMSPAAYRREPYGFWAAARLRKGYDATGTRRGLANRVGVHIFVTVNDDPLTRLFIPSGDALQGLDRVAARRKKPRAKVLTRGQQGEDFSSGTWACPVALASA